MKFRTVTINVNTRCPLKCRHCSVGSVKETADYRISAEELARTIAVIDSHIYGAVLFAGGEPSLEPELLRAGIFACKVRGLRSVLVSAPMWASNQSAAERFLDSIPGLDWLILSYDRYHLEFLRPTHYETALRAAVARGIMPLLHVVCNEEAEKTELLKQFSKDCPVVKISSMLTVPVGDAANLECVKMQLIAIKSMDDIVRIPRGCVAGNVHIDEKQMIHGCCWSRLVAGSPLSVAAPQGLEASMKQLEDNALFQGVQAHGFVDALTDKGRESLFQLLQGRSFANECHVCLTAMQEGPEEIWKEFVRNE